ncbi:F-type H+-transporting ATPase subunit delta [Prosthecobacter fusiformis]|uniref:F-type H+-transporting ATPase subunit delta n=1 Tax=Prosthecobacter fusiformis TaxID=48464 RepID=A0A4R7RKE2_9BACT|nr:F0F1 ATP synthase subunit delta [Prosthecobacter fusiformis]TDU64601.1 F-type H+-transporting ATPase subunit delta [Prosthecobacter fusiformis]
MKISKEVRRTSRQLFRVCLVDGKLDESRVRLVVNKIITSKPRGYLGMLDAFASLIRHETEGQRAIVESATFLTADIQAGLKSSLSQKYGRELALEFHINPDLLGGIRVKVGSDVWDGSVKARLEALKASLS